MELFETLSRVTMSLIAPSTTEVPYANSLDPDETQLGVSIGFKLFDTRTAFSQTFSDIEAL